METENKYITWTHHDKDYEHCQSRDTKGCRPVDEPYKYSHHDKIQAPRLPHERPFQLSEMLNRGIVGIVKTAASQKPNKEKISTHKNYI
jgi:hypothetical protein